MCRVCVERRRSGECGPFKLSKESALARVKKKKKLLLSLFFCVMKTKQSSELFLIKSSSLSLLFSLSLCVVEIRTTSRFSPQQVSSFDLQIYIYHNNIYIRISSFSRVYYTRRTFFFLRAHKQTQRWPRRSAAAARR